MKNSRTSLLCRISIVDGLIKEVLRIKTLKHTHQHISLINELNLTICDLEITKQNLFDDLAKLDFMKQFTKTPWVIKNNPSQPTYYQIVGVIGKVVTLSRKGVSKTISYQDFYRDYVEAKEEQVLQHVKYLTDNKIKFLFEPIPCDTTEIPTIYFSGGSIPATEHSIEVTKSADADFFCVTLKQGRGCTQYHNTYEQAETEAIRLSKQESKKAYVLGVVGEIEVVPTTTYETNITKY